MKKTKKYIKFLLRVVTISLIAIVVMLFASSIRDEWKSRKVSESINVYMPLNGNVAKIERINFN